MVGGGLLVGLTVAFLQYPLEDIYKAGKCAIVDCAESTQSTTHQISSEKSPEDMLKYVEHEMAILHRTVARGAFIEHPVRALMALTPEFYSLDFIEKITCSARVSSSLAAIEEPQECFFVIENKNRGATSEVIRVEVQVCHPDVRDCANGTARLTVN